MWTLQTFCFFFPRSGHHRDLHSFPTRRSSDLPDQHAEDNFEHDQRDPDEPGQRTGQVHPDPAGDRKGTRLSSSHVEISYAVFCLKKKMSTIADSRETAHTHNTAPLCHSS